MLHLVLLYLLPSFNDATCDAFVRSVDLLKIAFPAIVILPKFQIIFEFCLVFRYFCQG